ncbi:MAG: hemerythrin domain-containing protein [Legionella sp.]|nr:hemerythrin domain-containing protein [Legionella sp.]
MQARAPLMIEHRLIEQMLSVVERALILSEKTGSIDPLFVDLTVDFIKTYADRTHHGKEEDILFRELERKNLSEADRRVMKELIDEHVFGRMTTKSLVDANLQYRNGNNLAFASVRTQLLTLVEFYPKHIEKEDQVFFPASRAYFSDEEDQAMLREFMEFDRKMIHEKYAAVIKSLE